MSPPCHLVTMTSFLAVPPQCYFSMISCYDTQNLAHPLSCINLIFTPSGHPATKVIHLTQSEYSCVMLTFISSDVFTDRILNIKTPSFKLFMEDGGSPWEELPEIRGASFDCHGSQLCSPQDLNTLARTSVKIIAIYRFLLCNSLTTVCQTVPCRNPEGALLPSHPVNSGR